MSARQIKDWLATILDRTGNPTDTQGMATELNLPSIVWDFDEEKRAGAYGTKSYRLSPEPMETSMTFMGMSPELHDAIIDSFEANGELTLQLDGAAENVEIGNSIKYQVVMRGPVAQIPFGNFTAQENAEFELSMKVNYIKRIFGSSIFIYDPDNWELSLNGRNLLQSKKDALGL
ncbi:MAG: hypothetical protein F6K14_08115 [Symploca sp. SIO2C1]|nr:hypothetical protein [Symploca sp. SIO2C1]